MENNSNDAVILALVAKALLESVGLRDKIINLIEKENATMPQAIFSMIMLSATGAVSTNLPRDAFLKVCDSMYTIATQQASQSNESMKN